MAIYQIPGPIRQSDLVCNDLIVAGVASVALNAALNGTDTFLGDATGDKVGFFGSSSTQLASVSDPDGGSASTMVDALNYLVTRLDAFGLLK